MKATYFILLSQITYRKVKDVIQVAKEAEIEFYKAKREVKKFQKEVRNYSILQVILSDLLY